MNRNRKRKEEATASTSRRLRTEKRPLIEILSDDSGDEGNAVREVVREVKQEAISPGILAMEDLFARIRRDTFRQGLRSQRANSPPEANAEPLRTVASECKTEPAQDADTTQVLNDEHIGWGQLRVGSGSPPSREGSSSRDSNETLILRRRGSPSPRELRVSQIPVPPLLNVAKREEPSEPDTKQSSRKDATSQIRVSQIPLPPLLNVVKREEPGEADTKQSSKKDATSQIRVSRIPLPPRLSLVKNELTSEADETQPSSSDAVNTTKSSSKKKTLTKRQSPDKSKTKLLTSPGITKGRKVRRKNEKLQSLPKIPEARKVVPTEIDTKNKFVNVKEVTHSGVGFEKQGAAPTARNLPESQPHFGATEPTVAVVSHEPFDFNVQINQKMKNAIQKHNKKASADKKPVLKRLGKSPSKRKQPVKAVPSKRTETTKTVTEIKTEIESPMPNRVLESLNATAERIDVDDQNVSPLMADGLWDILEVISKRCGKNYTVVKSIIGMVEKGFTLPFICRYRREQSGGLTPEVIQFIKEEYLTLIEVRKKAKALVTKLDSEGNKDQALKEAILSSRTLEELAVVMEPFKQKGRRTHAARARSIGLEELALPIWRGEKVLRDYNLRDFVDPSTPGKADIADLLNSIRYILADELRRCRKILDRMEEISRNEADLHVKQRKGKSQSVIQGKETSDNFRDYFQFTRKVKAMESHQVLAINRGEQLGFLSVSVELMPFFERNFKDCLTQQFQARCLLDAGTRTLIRDAVDDSYERLCKPYITRVARAHLKDRAEKEALIVFSSNLRALLMTPPVRGESVLGIDPGFAKGCKLAVISKSGELLESAIMFMNDRPEQILTSLIKRHKCRLIAVGDGKGGQEVKSLITSCNKQRLFGENPVRFTTVREAGVSIYSVSKAAEEELPGLDCFVRGAVAIARRLQDPLVEFIKVEPKNLGIGMYQHDINESRLKEALQSTVVECVSFVGVDINVCPEFLLRQVAGLNATAAKNIIAYRNKHGPFKNREQLQMVPHIGPKRYEQCAGFVKILPETLKQCLDESLIVVKVQKPNEKAISEELEPLDTTIIHPESYGLARRIIADLGLDVKNIGTQGFIDTVKQRARADDFAQKFKASFLTVELILKALKARRNWDVRDEGSAPIFCAGSISMASIKIGQKVSGRVENVVPFGAFVDIAVDKDALIPTGFLGAARGIIKLGDIVECRVVKRDLARQRISLAFESFK